MLCKDTIMMITGGLLAGYGASQAMGDKKPFTKLEIMGPLIGGAALLGYGFMNYKKGGNGGYGFPSPIQKMGAKNAPSSPPAVLPSSPTKRVWANYTSLPQNTGAQSIIKSSGNASPQYDYNHIYPGII